MFFSLFLGIGVLFLPESPRWLASKHDWDGVRLSMARLRGKKDDPNHPLVEDDLQEMYALLEKEQKAGVKGWLACFSDLKSGVSRTTYRTLLGFAIHFFQQWTGINYFSEPINLAKRGDGGLIAQCTTVHLSSLELLASATNSSYKSLSVSSTSCAHVSPPPCVLLLNFELMKSPRSLVR